MPRGVGGTDSIRTTDLSPSLGVEANPCLGIASICAITPQASAVSHSSSCLSLDELNRVVNPTPVARGTAGK
ncbi:hypothetical protein RRG08_037993 [Elysia crispata]|uniref:Uncharacterized protein n=1 Tax=Elysia crispata TaxID=231223 RepID=A0AAE1DVY6_9GAST|nr:hypothetical protein RRG08_037993 [Elysia crispata]